MLQQTPVPEGATPSATGDPSVYYLQHRNANLSLGAPRQLRVQTKASGQLLYQLAPTTMTVNSGNI